MLKSLAAGGITFVVLQLLVWVQYVLADTINMRTVAQMQGRGIPQGLPIDYHYGIAGDWYYLSAVVAVLAALYCHHWSAAKIVEVALYRALPITVVLGIVWSLGATAEAHVINRWPTLVTWPHLVYMVPVITVLWLVYFHTPQAHVAVLVLTAVVFIVHIFVGQHMLLGLYKLWDPHTYSWYPDFPLRNPVAWAFLVGLTGAFVWRIWQLASNQ